MVTMLCLLIQAMQILQLSGLELEGRIEQELVENPLLELVDPTAPNEGEDAPDQDSELSAEDKALLDNFDQLDRLDRDFGDGGPAQPRSEDAEERRIAALQNAPDVPKSLPEALSEEIAMFDFTDRERSLAEHLIWSFDERGFLSDALEERRANGSPIHTLHWVSHGAPGVLLVGNTTINTKGLLHAQQQLANEFWQQADVISCDADGVASSAGASGRVGGAARCCRRRRGTLFSVGVAAFLPRASVWVVFQFGLTWSCSLPPSRLSATISLTFCAGGAVSPAGSGSGGRADNVRNPFLDEGGTAFGKNIDPLDSGGPSDNGLTPFLDADRTAFGKHDFFIDNAQIVHVMDQSRIAIDL